MYIISSFRQFLDQKKESQVILLLRISFRAFLVDPPTADSSMNESLKDTAGLGVESVNKDKSVNKDIKQWSLGGINLVYL
jgi:hypothetical protein